MSTVHEEDKPHLCYCDKSYNTMNSLKKHVKLVHEKPFDNKQSLKEYARFVTNFIGNMRKQRPLNVQNVIGILKTNVLLNNMPIQLMREKI
jgi:hypothetical protein